MSNNLFVIDESSDDDKNIVEPVEQVKKKRNYEMTEKRVNALEKARKTRQANALIRKNNREAFKKQLKIAENYRGPVESTNEINELKEMLKKLLLEKEESKLKEQPETKPEKQELEIKIVKEKKKPVKKVKIVEVTDTDATVESEIEVVKKPKRTRATRHIEPPSEVEESEVEYKPARRISKYKKPLGYEESKNYSPPPRHNFVSSFF